MLILFEDDQLTKDNERVLGEIRERRKSVECENLHLKTLVNEHKV